MNARFSFHGHLVDEETLAKLLEHEHLVLKENHEGGALIVLRKTQRFVPVPRKATEK